MQNFKLIALLLLSIATLTSCNSKTPSQPIASNAPNSYPEGDIYDMTYQVCSTVCGRTSKIVTWGRPTEVGIAYYAEGFPEQITGNQRIEKMADRKSITLVVKSKGTLPALKIPLESERFVPVEHFRALGFNPITKQEALKVEGRVEILSITKIARSDREDPTLIAMKTLQTKISDEDMINPGSIKGFLGLTKKDPDINPQQVEKISWQEGQQPQIITLKAW